MSEEKFYPFAKEFHHSHLSKIEQPDNVIEILKNWTLKPTNLLYFAGSVGCGKTYFSAAFYNYLVEKIEKLESEHKEKGQYVYIDRPRYFTEYNLFTKLRKSIQNGSDWEEELQRLCEVKFFILDDMGSSRLSEWQIDVLQTFIDIRVSNLQPTLITSNIYTKDLNEKFHPRVKSRVCASRNIIVELEGPDKRQINQEVKDAS